MATENVTNTQRARILRQQQIAAQQQNQAAARATLPQHRLVSPLDGTSPVPGLGVNPLAAANPLGTVLGGRAGTRPQVNATNQSALAPNGDINQTVSNTNTYENRIYNLITPFPQGVGGGAWAPYGWGTGYGQPVVDPATGAMYVRQGGGFIDWIKRLFRGY